MVRLGNQALGKVEKSFMKFLPLNSHQEATSSLLHNPTFYITVLTAIELACDMFKIISLRDDWKVFYLSILWRTHTCTFQGRAGCRRHDWHKGWLGNTWSSAEFGNVAPCSQEDRYRWHCLVQEHRLTWTQSSFLHSGSNQVDMGPCVGSTHPGSLGHTWTHTHTHTKT